MLQDEAAWEDNNDMYLKQACYDMLWTVTANWRALLLALTNGRIPQRQSVNSRSVTERGIGLLMSVAW